MKKRVFSGILASVLLVSGSAAAFAGCGPKVDDDIIIDETKTQIYVGNEGNGYGSEWLEKTADAFEEWAAEKSYEPNKKGVQVIMSHHGFAGGTILPTLSSSQANVIFSEECYYYDFLSKNVLADVTNAVTTPLTEFGEDKSIEQKMVADNGNQLKDALTGYDGKYYALPWWTGLQGISYDRDLFNDEQLFIAKGGSPSEYLRTENTETGVAAPLSGSFTSYQWTTDEGDLAAGPARTTTDFPQPTRNFTRSAKECSMIAVSGSIPSLGRVFTNTANLSRVKCSTTTRGMRTRASISISPARRTIS